MKKRFIFVALFGLSLLLSEIGAAVPSKTSNNDEDFFEYFSSNESLSSSSEDDFKEFYLPGERIPTGGGNCTEDDDCSGGLCNITRCKCYAAYSGEFCQIRRHGLRTAFLLDLLLGYVGGGRFSLGYTGIASGKLVIFVVTIFVSVVSCCMDSYDDCCVPFRIGHVVFSLTVIVWYLTDVILIGTRKMVDSRGLYPYGHI